MSLDRTTPPPVHMMGHLTLSDPTTEILNNGIVLNTVRGGSQEVNQLSMIWPGGDLEVDPRPVARLTANVMREGTATRTGAEINEALDFNGAMLRIVSDGHYSSLNVTSLNSKTQNVLPVLADIITAPSFPEDTFRLMRDIEVKELLLSQSKVMVLCHQLLSRMIKGKDNPESVVPTPEQIQSITRADLRRFHSRVFTSRGCKAYLSGNITDDVYADVKAMLESMPDLGPAVPLRVVPLQSEAPGLQRTELPDAVQAAVSMAIPAPPRSHPDYVPLRFTVIALGGYFGSRLMKNIREDKGYTYGIGAYLIGSLEGSYVLISAQADPRYIEPLIDEVKAEIRRLATEPMPADELMRLRQYISSSIMETLDSPFSIMDYYKVIDVVGLPPTYFDDQVRWVHDIDADTIMQMASRYLDPDALRIAVCS